MRNQENVFNDCHKGIAGLVENLPEHPTRAELSQLIEEFPDCEQAIRAHFKIWMDLSDIEVHPPSATMSANFYKALAEVTAQEQVISQLPLLEYLSQWMTNLTIRWKLSFIAATFLIGILLGRFIIPSGKPDSVRSASNDELQYLNYVAQVAPVSATMKLSLLHEIKKKGSADKRVMEALYQALINDPNINVRLSAMETLVFYADQPMAREMLIEAIPFQDSPLVQVALADAMLLLHETNSIEAWQRLIKSGEVEPEVKIHLEETMENLL